MLIDGLTLIEGASVANLVVANGSNFPTLPDQGELFYLNIAQEFFPIGLYVYSGTEWTQVATSAQLNEVATAATVVTAGTTYPSPAVNGELFYKSTSDITGDVGLYVYQESDSQWHAVSSGAEITNHINDTAVHLTSTQNTWLDSITATSTEVNYLSGVTSSVQTQLSSKLNSSGGTISGNIVVPTGVKITIADAPSNSIDAVNKAYVDSNLAGLSWKNSVKVATTANITLSGTQTIDGISVVAGDRVLVKNQTTTSQNGIYIVASGSWSRATDMDSTTPINEVNSAAVFVEQGTSQADTGWTQINLVTTLGTDAVSFTQFNGAAGITAGVGLDKSGNTLNVLLGAGIAELPTDEIGIDLLTSAGLFLTENGSTDSTATGAKLAVKLDGTSLTRSANGLKVSDGGITAAKIASSAIGSTLVGGDGAVINLATTGVTAGTATKVTVDVYGRVTSGSTLLESDIPNLSWSKITSGTPTTLAGYGITDAAPSSHVSDYTLHLTSAQNTWLDSITATSAEVNYLSGVTSAIQTQLNAKQALDGDLTAIAGLTGTSGFLKKTAADTWALDTSTYLTGNQTITLTGAVTGSGTTSINITLADSGVTLGTYRSVTVNAKGIVTSGTNPITLAGYGITDALSTSLLGVANGVATLDSTGLIPSSQLPSYVDDVLEYTNLATFPVSGTSGKIYVAQDTSKIYRWSGSAYIEISPTAGNADTATKLATSRSISTTGDATWSVSFDGSANVSAALTLANSGVSAGTYKSVTVNAKGLVTGGTNPTTLAGYGITDAQALDADLTAIAGLAGTSGFLKKTAADTWALDTSTYLTGNQSITVSGDASGTGTTAISLTLANSGVTAGTYNNSATQTQSFTVDAKGRITTTGTATTITPAWSSITSKPTTLTGYGITDAQALDADLTAIAGLAGTSGFLKKTAADTWALDTSTYLTGNQSITVSGDASGIGTTAISLTLANSGVSAGTYFTSSTSTQSITVDAKGRITGFGASNTITPAWSSITSKPTTISGYGITDAYTKTEVDSFLQGLDPKASVVAATTANITLSGTQTIDGIAVIAGDRVLVKNQTTTSQNGIYTVSATAWTRVTDMSVWAEVPGAFTFVEKGTTYADTGWVCTSDVGGTLDTTAITFVQFAGAGSVTSGTGISVTGTQVSLASGVATAGTYKSVTVDTYGRVTAGTNPTTLAGYGITDAAPSSHTSDYTLHLNSAQNTWLDTITVTSAEVNYLSGVTSAIQTQLNAKQALDADLTAIAALAGTSGFLKKTAADTWTLDTSTYLTSYTETDTLATVTGRGATTTTPIVINASSASDALRITQAGAGNAFVVEDSTNPDSTPFVIDTNGNLTIGYATGTYKLNVKTDSYSEAALDGVLGGYLHFRRVATSQASPTVVASGNVIGQLVFEGYDGSAYKTSATIEAIVDNTPGTNDMPGRLVFSTTADGASTPTERMRIDSSGNVGIGAAANAAVKVDIVGTLPTAFNESYGIWSRGTIPVGSTSSAYGVISNQDTAASAFTVTNVYRFAALQGTIGATSSITSQYGFFAASSLTGATNNYGFYSNIASGTGRYNFYANGTAANYFAGATTIGSMLTLPNTSAQSLTDGALWANGASGAILFDDAAHKRISWNDGGGNFNIRAGNYHNGTSVLYTKGTSDANGGAAAITLANDAVDGTISLNAAVIGTPGAAVSWGNSVNISPTQMTISAGTTSTSTSTGALVVSGGAGIAGNTYVGGNLSVTGNLTINGTTTTVNSTTVTVDDPIITLGGDTAPAADDNKDRGVEFRYHNGTAAKVGFFGFDDSTGKFTFIPDATNTSEVFSGTQGTISANVLESTVATGTAPLAVTSTTVVTNLNADMLDGKHVGTSGNAIPLLDGTNTWSSKQSFTNVNTIFGTEGSSQYLEIATATNFLYLDFHSSNTAVDYNARISCGGATAGLAAGDLTFESANASFTGNISSSKVITASKGINPGAVAYPIYEANVDFGAAVANTWVKIVGASLANTTYSTVGFIIEVIDPQANHAVAASVNTVIKETYHVACVRAESTTADTPDACYVSGPSNRIRAIKTAVGAYEIQIQNLAQYREYKIRISTYASNASHTIDYFNGTTAGTATATYTAASGASVDYFQNINVVGTVTGNSLTSNSISTTNGNTTSATLTTSATTANQVVMNHAIATYRSVQYQIQVTSSTSYHSTIVNVIHNGTTAYITEYGTIFTGSSLATFDADISGGNLRLLVTPTNAVSTIKVIASAINI